MADRRYWASRDVADSGSAAREDPAAVPDEPTVAPAASAAVKALVPALLPPRIRGFTGRANELDELDSLLDGGQGRSGTVVISAITGAAGIGKTKS